MQKPFVLEAPFKPAGQQSQAIKKLVGGLRDGLSKQTLLGVTGSGKTFTLANVIAELQRPALLMAPNKTLAAQLYGEMRSFFPKNAVEYFVSYYDYYQPEAYVPSTDTFIEKDAAINEHIEQMRLSATKAILERQDTIIVCSVSAIYGLGDPESYMRMVLHLSCGHIMDRRELMNRLAALQYTRNDVEMQRGNYRVHGEVVDIFPAESNKEAVRVHLCDDEIESLSYFDPLTGQVLQSVDRLTIHPKSHYVTPRERVTAVTEEIKDELRQRLESLRAQDKLVEAQRLEQRVRYDLEMMLELGYCSGIENYSRYLSGRGPGEPPPTLLDYVPSNALLMLDESHVTVSQIGGMFKGDRARKQNLVEYGFRLPSALDNRPLQFDEFEALSPQTIYISATPGNYEAEHADQVVELVVRPTGLLDPEVEVRPAGSQVEDLLGEARTRVESGERVLVTTLTKKMAEDLTDYLTEQKVKVRYLHSDVDTVERMEIIRDLRLGVFDVLVGINLLREGLDIPEVSLVAILDADKEGFLRSERSLIQTMGRAARNVNGHVILYADKVTDSMRRAMDETQRRREIQEKFNEEHGIVPETIKREVNDIMRIGKGAGKEKKAAQKFPADTISTSLSVKQSQVAFHSDDPKKVAKEIQRLEKAMHKHAKNLEFEEAAQVRDELNALRQYILQERLD